MSGGAHRLLVVVAADYESARTKGVDGLFLEYDEGGFFERVVLVSPYMRRDARIVLGPRHELLEFGTGRGRLARRLGAPLHLVRLIRRCAAIVRQERIDLIRATEPTLCGLIAWATSRLTSVPYCVSLHADYDKLFLLDGKRGAPTIFGSRALVRPLERRMLSGAARVMPIRESLVGYALSRGVDRARVRVVPHGVDAELLTAPAAIDIRQQLGIPAKPIVAFVGRLSAENYVEDVLDAARAVGERRDDFVLVMAGGGVLGDAVAARVHRDPVLARVVRLPGFLPPESIRALRQASAVSVCLMGGFSLIEACAAGRAVIAYDVDWHHELVIDGTTGRLVAEHDVRGVADAIGALLDDPAQAARLGREAQRLACERHAIRHTQSIKRGVYDEILQPGGGGPRV